MRLERSKNTKRNIEIGFINKIISLFFPFFVQTIFIKTLGVEYLGLRGVFSSILQVLNLAELGFGSAMVFNMYEAIADDNDELICALLGLYKKIYRYIGVFILTVGLLMMPFIPKMITGGYPNDINIFIIYLMYVANTVLSYCLYSYKISLLNAFQRQDIIGLINMIVQCVINFAQIIYLIVSKNFYIYLSLQILSTILSNIIIAISVDKIFPEYYCRGTVPQHIIAKTKKKMIGLMLYKLCGVTRNSFDNIFISMYLGLTLVGMYNNYYYIITNVLGLLSIVTSSMLAGVGNSIALENKEKNYKDMMNLDCIYMVFAGWCTICMLCLFQPFMRIWMGESLVFPFSIATLFAIYFYILCMGNIRALYSDAAGLWWENRYRTLVEAIANIILNYLFVKLWGVYGIILATIITLFLIGYASSAIVLFKGYFHFGLKNYFLNHIKYMSATIINCIITLAICCSITGNEIRILLGRLAICCVATPMIYFIIFLKNKTFTESFQWLRYRLLDR